MKFAKRGWKHSKLCRMKLLTNLYLPLSENWIKPWCQIRKPISGTFDLSCNDLVDHRGKASPGLPAALVSTSAIKNVAFKLKKFFNPIFSSTTPTRPSLTNSCRQQYHQVRGSTRLSTHYSSDLLSLPYAICFVGRRKGSNLSWRTQGRIHCLHFLMLSAKIWSFSTRFWMLFFLLIMTIVRGERSSRL